jgi:hypothetical protein
MVQRQKCLLSTNLTMCSDLNGVGQRNFEKLGAMVQSRVQTRRPNQQLEFKLEVVMQFLFF